MKKYIAFQRGINVGNIRIKMTDLTRAFEDFGFKNVKTYLQTGNIVFDTEGSLLDIKPVLEKKLSDTFKYEAYALLYEFDVLTEIVAQYPFERLETHHAYVIFVDNTAVFDNLKILAQDVGEETQWIAFGDNQVIYWQVEIGSTLHTPFAKILAKAKFKANATTRNLNTLEKMSFEF